jgi:hypothetical protein
VPPPPKIRDRARHIGIIEIFQEVKSKDPAKADCHIRIGGKVKKDLQGIGNRSKPRRGRRYIPPYVKNLIRDKARVIGQQQFFAQSNDKTAKPPGEIFRRFFAAFDLFSHRLVPDNGPRDKLGKQGDIQGNVETVFLCPGRFAIHVKDVGHDLKRKKGYADWQVYIDIDSVVAQQNSDGSGYKRHILKDKKQRYIVRHGNNKE